MGKLLGVLYGVAVYTLFLGTILYSCAFVGNLPVPKTIDSGENGPLVWSVVIDLLLLALFAVQHSVMARPGFKRWWTRLVPQFVERSTFVLFASLALLLLYWQWRPISDPIWTLEGPFAAFMTTVSWIGWGLVLLSTFLINHFELFGLQQVFHRLMGRTAAQPTFRTPLLYKRVRHPIYLGFILAFWATPVMTSGHLIFAVMTTVYILIGIALEERDLIDMFGDQYRRYRKQVPMLIPLRGRRDGEQPSPQPPVELSRW